MYVIDIVLAVGASVDRGLEEVCHAKKEVRSAVKDTRSCLCMKVNITIDCVHEYIDLWLARCIAYQTIEIS
jgi:hypothetical protein